MKLPTWSSVLTRMETGHHDAVDRFLFHCEPEEPRDEEFRELLTEALAEVVEEATLAERQRIGEAVQAMYDSEYRNPVSGALEEVLGIVANGDIEEDEPCQ